MKLSYVGHACAVVEHNGKRLVFDPWLGGPVYWGSWWHFPNPVFDVSIFAADFIYLSHWHFDHMHAESLEKFSRKTHLILPKFPVSGLPEPLKSMGFETITEIGNEGTFELAPGFRLTSYQIQLQDDSAAVVECDLHEHPPVIIFNMNDAKPLSTTWKRMKKRFPRVDIMLRSHSPAWSYPTAFTFDDPSEALPVSKDSYKEAFRAAAAKLGAKYAVPFASGVCHLTDDTLFENQNLILAPELKAYFDAHPLAGTELVAFPPGSTFTPLDGFRSPPGAAVKEGVDAFVERARQNNQNCLERCEAEIDARILTEELFAQYFAAFRSRSRPLWLAIRACWQFDLISSRGSRTLYYDFNSGRVCDGVARPLGKSRVTAKFTIREGILADALETMTFSNIDVAKRWKVHLAKGEVTRYFVINTFMGLNEAGYLRAKNLASARLWTGLIRRHSEIADYMRLALRLIARGKSAALASAVGTKPPLADSREAS